MFRGGRGACACGGGGGVCVWGGGGDFRRSPINFVLKFRFRIDGLCAEISFQDWRSLYVFVLDKIFLEFVSRRVGSS